MSTGKTWFVTVPRALPFTPPVACVVGGGGVNCRIGSATVKSNRWVLTVQPAALIVLIT
jgi:hypothetical protein